MGELTDKIKGNVNEAIGKAKQHSSDPETKAKGAAQELKGKAQQVAGDVKGALGDKIQSFWVAPERGRSGKPGRLFLIGRAER
jgi:uncharacterized protein YjbJ (UPF0337 family)